MIQPVTNYNIAFFSFTRLLLFFFSLANTNPKYLVLLKRNFDSEEKLYPNEKYISSALLQLPNRILGPWGRTPTCPYNPIPIAGPNPICHEHPMSSQVVIRQVAARAIFWHYNPLDPPASEFCRQLCQKRLWWKLNRIFFRWIWFQTVRSKISSTWKCGHKFGIFT